MYLLITLALIPLQDFKSFIVEHPCHFYMVKRSEIQQKEVLSGGFEPRTKQNDMTSKLK